jgi:plastocyanin
MLGKAGSTPRARVGTLGLAVAAALALIALLAPAAQAGTGKQCPTIKNKPDQIPHVNYPGLQHLTYCVGPVNIKPGQNLIRLYGTNLFPKVPGYITRFDPDLVYPSGRVPRVDILHLHHAVWLVNGNPQFAVGEEKTIQQLPQGFGWRSTPSDSWGITDMLHDLTAEGGKVYIVWRIDFVPDTSPAAATMKTARTQWMDVSGPSPGVGISSPIYPVFNALKGWGTNGKYTFPDQAQGKQAQLVGPSQTWTVNKPITLLGSAGHLHPGGLYTDLDVTRNGQTKRLFRSRAHYYEPAGAVSWDVSMGATPKDWRVQLQPGDQLSVHATYDTSKASWYEVMGIMPVAVYDGTNVGGVDPFTSKLDQKGVLTHGHLRENRHHGGGAAGLPNPLSLPNGPLVGSNPVDISNFLYSQGDLHTSAADRRPPTVYPGQSITFDNLDSATRDAYHTITACRAPCNRDTGIAYPIANANVSFDSSELGHNSTPWGAPASGTDTWTTPKGLKPGTYTYFCRIHPFMRGSFRVIKPPKQ